MPEKSELLQGTLDMLIKKPIDPLTGQLIIEMFQSKFTDSYGPGLNIKQYM